MAGKSFNPKDSGYVEVKYRIEKFYEKYPEGAIRTSIFEITDDRVTVGAEAFAHKDDAGPVGTGFSWLAIPGATSFTKGSELENAETSAIGRAIAAAGFEVHASYASADEIRAKAGDAPTKTVVPAAVTALKSDIRTTAEAMFGKADWKTRVADLTGLTFSKDDTEEELRNALNILTEGEANAAENFEEGDDISF